MNLFRGQLRAEEVFPYPEGLCLISCFLWLLTFQCTLYNCIHRCIGGYYISAFDPVTPPPQWDFAVTPLVPLILKLELLNFQGIFSLRISCLGIFLGSFWKTGWPPQPNLYFFSSFFLTLLLWLCYSHSFQTFRNVSLSRLILILTVCKDQSGYSACFKRFFWLILKKTRWPP